MCYNDNDVRAIIMTKINCCINLKENDKLVFDNKNVIGIKRKNKITYQNDNILVTVLIDDNKITMKRISDEYNIILSFEEKNNTKGEYFLNNSNLMLPLNIFTDKILVSEKKIEITYKIENNVFDFAIDFEVIK